MLKFAFRFAVHFHDIQNVAKVPFSMIEDIMESQTIEKAEALWQIIESLVEVITQPDIFPKGTSCSLQCIHTCLIHKTYSVYVMPILQNSSVFTSSQAS